MDSILLPSELNVSAVTYSTPRTLDNGGRAIYMSFNKAPIVIQTPEMIAPYGVSNWNDDGKGPDKYSLDLSFTGKDTRENLNTFFEKMDALDKKLVQDAFANSMTWLKKTCKTIDVVEALYTPMVKYSKDKTTGEITDKYPPTFKLKIPYSSGTFNCEAYDDKRNALNMRQLIDNGTFKGARVIAIIQCLGIWIAGGKFGCSWKVLQMRVALPKKIQGYAFKDIPDDKANDSDIDDDDEDDDAKAGEILQNATEDLSNLNVDDSDELIETSDDDLETPVRKEKEPVKKKNVVKK